MNLPQCLKRRLSRTIQADEPDRRLELGLGLDDLSLAVQFHAGGQIFLGAPHTRRFRPRFIHRVTAADPNAAGLGHGDGRRRREQQQCENRKKPRQVSGPPGLEEVMPHGTVRPFRYLVDRVIGRVSKIDCVRRMRHSPGKAW